MMQKISFVECDRDTGNGNRPYVDVQYSLKAYYNVVGGGFSSPTVFGVLCDSATAALIEADPECLVHTDDNLFLDFDDANKELHWQNELKAWLNG